MTNRQTEHCMSSEPNGGHLQETDPLHGLGPQPASASGGRAARIPQEARALAERALAAAAAAKDTEAEIAARYALGWAQHVLGDDRAEKTLRTGIRLAERHGDRRSRVCRKCSNVLDK